MHRAVGSGRCRVQQRQGGFFFFLHTFEAFLYPERAAATTTFLEQHWGAAGSKQQERHTTRTAAATAAAGTDNQQGHERDRQQQRQIYIKDISSSDSSRRESSSKQDRNSSSNTSSSSRPPTAALSTSAARTAAAAAAAAAVPYFLVAAPMDPSTSAYVPSGWLTLASKGDLSPVSVCGKDGRTYKVRLMKPSDYSGVCELLPLVSRGQQRLSDETLAAVLKQPTYFPFCCFLSNDGNGRKTDEQQLCGFCEVYVQPHLRRAADGRLERVVVAQDFRGCGVATAMCQAVLQLAKNQLNLGRIDLTVEKPDAKHIYTKLGFTTVDTETLRLQL
ncbi:hypothetical protein ACSSS7_007497 [Eimeria intestinalis]